LERTQEEKLLGGIAHIAVLFSWLGLALNAVLYLVYKPKSKFVTGHAKQALGLWGVWFLVKVVLGMVAGGSALAVMNNPFGRMGMAGLGVAAVGGLLTAALGIAVLVMVIQACIKGFNGQEYKYPIIGEMVAGIGD
jgi:uncharacterized Tic20 family protein